MQILRFVAFTEIQRAVHLKQYSAHVRFSRTRRLRYTWKYKAAVAGEDIRLHTPYGLLPSTATGELTWRQFLRQEQKLCRISPSVRIVRSSKQGGSKSFRRSDLKRSKVINESIRWVRAPTPRIRAFMSQKKTGEGTKRRNRFQPPSSTFITYCWCCYPSHRAFADVKLWWQLKVVKFRRATSPSAESNRSATTVHRTLTWYGLLPQKMLCLVNLNLKL